MLVHRDADRRADSQAEIARLDGLLRRLGEEDDRDLAVEALIEAVEVKGLASTAVERLEASGEVVAIPVLQHEGAVSSKAPQRKKAMAY